MYDKAGKLVDRRELLKIKFNSLMAEAHIIRAAERKQKAYGKRAALPQPWLYQQMHEHRVLSLRHTARLTSLALGWIRGRSLEEMEGNCHRPLTKRDLEEVKSMLTRYGGPDALARWISSTTPVVVKPESVAA